MKNKKNQEKPKKPFYKKWWFIAIVVIAILGTFIDGSDDDKVTQPQENASSTVEENQEINQEATNMTADTADYEIVQKNDVSFGNTKRYGWEVVVKEPVNTEQLEEIAKQVVAQAKTDIDFNALAIGFYDYEEFIGHGYVLGKVVYAPKGDWEKADTVKAGQYDQMDYHFELREKDWSKQLTKEEVALFKEWHELYDSKLTYATLVDEEEINKEIAKRFNMGEEDVYNTMIKQSLWMFNDNQ